MHAHKKIRALNRSAVLNTIITHGPVSRVSLSKMTGLNQSTVSKITSELIDEGAIFESSRENGNGLGRKPVNLKVSPDYRIYGSIDITLRHTTLSVCDLSGDILSQRQIDTFPKDAEKFFNTCASEMAEMIKGFSQPMAGVSVIVPCMLDSAKGLLYWNKTLGWVDVHCLEIVQPYFDCPVFVENDARAGAVAELWFAEEARNLRDFIYVLVCEGVGSGTVIHGKLYTGTRYLEGIFYSGSVDIEGELELPSRGTNWEDRASYEGIVERYCQLSGDQKQKDLQAQANKIIDMAVEGDTSARKALRETAKWLGAGLANINNGLDPERIILAGYIVKAWKLIYPELLGQLRAGAPFPMEHLPDLVVPCSLENPTVYGARALILQNMLGNHAEEPRQGQDRQLKAKSKPKVKQGAYA